MQEGYCAYLRKSREDNDFIIMGMSKEAVEEETLERHKKIIEETAKKMKITISKFYVEGIKSGDSIESRPIMKELLKDVNSRKWKGVIVVEIERLARGNSIDQGIVTQSFMYSNTLIITPYKTYNLQAESDQDFCEFGLFMSRFEYKTINKRLQRGRIQSVNEGLYAGNIPPFGFARKKVKGAKGYILIQDEQEQEIYKLIWQLYSSDEFLFLGEVERELKNRGIKTRTGKDWTRGTIKDLLTNPIAIGYIRWNQRKGVKFINEAGKIEVKRPRNKNKNNDIILSRAKDLQPCIDEETWEKVQKKLKNNRTNVNYDRSLKNVFCGILVCEKCGNFMTRKPDSKVNGVTLLCLHCDNISSKFDVVESQIIKALELWLNNYKIEYIEETENILEVNKNKEKIRIEAKKSLEMNLKQEKNKLNKIFDNFEQNIYTNEDFLVRSKLSKNAIAELEKQLKNLEEETIVCEEKEEIQKAFIPKFESLIEVLKSNDVSIRNKNALMKELIEKITYLKTEKVRGKNSNFNNFNLKIYPKIPKHN